MKFLTLIVIVLIISCQSRSDKTQNERKDSLETESSYPKVNDEFTLYLNNFKKASLPITIKGCYINWDTLNKLDKNLFSKYTSDNISFVQIPTNGTYIATITFAEADCLIPILTTYKLNGQIIDSKGINIGGCGSDCGFDCEEFMNLRKDFTFYTSDTISTFDCDSLGNEIPGTYEYYVSFMEGKLLTNGIIETSKKIKKPLEGRKNGL